MTAGSYADAAGLVERSAAAYAAAVPVAPQDDGFFGPASVAWRVSTDLAAPVAGLRSLLIQALHPLAMAGVDQHSDWRTDPVGRLAATSAYEVTVTFGDRAGATRAAQRVRAIHEHHPGDHLRLTVRRGTTPPKDVDVTLANQGGRAFLGVQLDTRNLQPKVPFTVDIDSGNVVGPSAGLAFSLELLDALTPGELTGGVSVAVTGELSMCGEVRPIGGIVQKVASVKHSGASVFLVPRDDYAVASAHAGSHLKVYAVNTFDDALRVLGGLAGSNAAALGLRPGT